MIDWSLYHNFSENEFACQCGKCGFSVDMSPDLLERLQRMREMLGRVMIIRSGYRCPLHPVEAKKDRPGSHAAGMAADIAASTAPERFSLVRAGIEVGMVGIGVAHSFIHLDVGHPSESVGRPAVWIY